MELLTNIKQLINDDLVECKLILKEEEPKELFSLIDRVLKVSNGPKKEELAKISNYDMFRIFLNATNTNIYSFNETEELIKPYEHIINNWTYDTTKDIFLVLHNHSRKDESDISPTIINTFLKLDLPQELLEYRMSAVYLAMNRFLEFKQRLRLLSNITSNVLLNVNYKPRNIDKTSMAKKYYVECQLDILTKLLSNYVNDNHKEFEERKKIVRIKIKIYEQILESINDNTITNMIDPISEEWCTYLHPHIASELLQFILLNQTIEYNTELEMNKISNNIINKTPLTKYLYEHNINPNTITNLEQLEQYEDTIPSIEFLLSLGLTNIKDYTNIITIITKDKITFINNLLTNNIINKSTIINNIEYIFNNIDTIKTNYDILSNNIKIDFNNKYYKDTILLENTTKLRNIISILIKYNFNEQEQDIFIFLLCNNNMINIYDIILENNIPERLLFSICNTHSPINTIKRILIYQEIDTPYTTNGVLKKEVQDENKFYLYDKELDEYIGNIVDDNTLITITGDHITNIDDLLIVKYLDNNNLNTKRTYKIGDTIISRPKFLKNLQKAIDLRLDINKCLLPLFLSNSIYKEKDIFDINELIKKQKAI